MQSGILEMNWHGVDGSVWDVLEASEGVLLAPKPSGLYDSKIETMWVKSQFGDKYQSSRPARRDVVLTFILEGATVDGWEELDSDFRMSWSDEEEGMLEVVTNSDRRYIFLRLLEEPKSYQSQDWEGFAPHLRPDAASVQITAAAEIPYYFGDPMYQDFEFTPGETKMVPFWNPGDVPLWPRYTGSAPGRWVLPDPSWGQKWLGRAVEDADRVVPLPELRDGENFSLDMRPDEEKLIAENGANIEGRWGGKTMLYPIPKWTKPTLLPITYKGAATGNTVLENGGFTGSLSGWWNAADATWDALGGRGVLSAGAKVTADGSWKILVSNQFDVEPGEFVPAEAYVKWAGLVGAGEVAQVSVQFLDGANAGIQNIVVGSLTDPAVSGVWTRLGGTAEAPTGAVKAEVRLTVTSGATAGTFTWDNAAASVAPKGYLRVILQPWYSRPWGVKK